MHRFLILVIALGTVSVCAADFTRYQVILNRMPFGSEAAPVAPGMTADGKPLAPVIPQTLKMCAITRQALTAALQVGLVDTVSKKNYFITVGETEDGITVVDADYENEKALLRKDGRETWITMSDVASMGAAIPAIPGIGPGRPRLPVPGMGGMAGMPPAGVPMPSRFEGGVRRRDLAAGMTNRVSGEALQKHLEQYQMDLIRAGGEKGPPLPMPLTPAMDEQLVKEGVLPPQ